MYKSKGLLLFAYGKDGDLYTRELTIETLARSHHMTPEDMQTLQELCYTYNIDENDLIDGKEFLEDVRSKCIIDYDGSLEYIFVNGYESNLGLASTDFCQGKFLVMEDVFEELCEEYDIKVDFAGR